MGARNHRFNATSRGIAKETDMDNVQRACVAGIFYPGEPDKLSRLVAAMVDEAPAEGPAPAAIIAPHAGYIYSGPIAARAYARLAPLRGTVERVILIGPAHRLAFRGIAAPSAESFETPLGTVPVDRAAIARILTQPGMQVNDAAFDGEHCIEVQLPFLQTVLGAFRLVPLIAGHAGAKDVADILDALWTGPETLPVISSDLSHYHDYDTARRRDAETARAIEAMAGERLDYDDACGRTPIAGLLQVARSRGLAAQTVDLRNSGDTAGPRGEVVGYGAWVVA
jgi:MEMO1 family protein